MKRQVPCNGRRRLGVRRQPATWFVGLLAIAMASGCASSAGSSTAGADAVKVMLITQSTSATPGISPYPEIEVAAKAGVLAVNDKGGINGRDLDVEVCDTKGLPNGAVLCANKAVRERVAAVVGSFDLYGTYLSVLERAKIPSIAPFAIGKEETSPVSFPLWGGGRALVSGLVSLLVDQGATSIAFMSSQNPASSATLDNSLAPSRKAFPDTDIDVVTIPANTLDYSAVVAAARRARGISVGTYPNDAITVISQLAQLGTTQPIVTSILSVDQNGLKQLGDKAEGVFAVSGFLPPSHTDDPAVATFVKYMNRVDGSAAKGDHAANAFSGMLLFAKVANGLPEINGQSVMKALAAAGPIDLGLLPPVDFGQPLKGYPGATRQFNMKVTYVQIKGGQYTLLNDGKFYDAVTGK